MPRSSSYPLYPGIPGICQFSKNSRVRLYFAKCSWTLLGLCCMPESVCCQESGAHDSLPRRPSYDHIGCCDIGLYLHIWMAHDVCQEFCRLRAHVPDVDVNDRQRRFYDLGKWEIIKGHNADILRNTQSLFCGRIHAPQSDVIVGADDGAVGRPGRCG